MKTKTSLWLGVCTLVLCLGVMITGVYSALSANLNIGGKLGFNMHDCMVTVSGTIQNLAKKTSVGNISYADLSTKGIETTIMGGENTTTANLSFGELYFFQYDASNVYDIIFEISFTNISATSIKATIPAPTVGTGVTIITDSASGYTTLPVSDAIIAQNATYTVKFALRLNSLDALSNNVNFSWNNITFEEYQAPTTLGNDISINLTATEANIDIAGTKTGYWTSSTTYETSRQNITDETITIEDTEGAGTTSTVDVGTLYFADTTPAQPIILTLTATNNSSTQISALLVVDEIIDANYTIEYTLGTDLDAEKTAHGQAVILEAGSSIIFTITINSTEYKLIMVHDLIISGNFTKYVKEDIQSPYEDEVQGLTYTLNDAGTAWSVAGGKFVHVDMPEPGVPSDQFSDNPRNRTDITIASELFGLPVTEIPDNAFGMYVGAGTISSTITSVIIPNTITKIGSYAFYHCVDLTSVTIPDSITSIGSYAFSNCTSLASITITNSVTSIGDCAFSGCIGLTSITIPNSVTSIGESAFNSCTGLTTVTIGSGVETIGDLAFFNCTKLASVINKSSLLIIKESTTYGYVAYYANEVISSSNYVTNENGYMIYEDFYLLGYIGTETELTLPEGITIIAERAFKGNNAITKVIIPDSVTSINNSAFYGCSGLTSLTIGSRVETIGSSAFYGCSGLTSLTIGSRVETIGSSAFYKCSSLTSINIPDSVTSIGNYAFYYCTGLTSVSLGNSVTSIGDRAFYGCDSLTSINIPDSVTSVGVEAFYYCTGLTSVSLGNSVTSIGSRAFSYCDALSSITVSTGNTKYDSRNNCNAIIETASNTLIQGCKNSIIPDSVTSIGESAFNSCTSLTSVTIPDSVTSIGERAFYGCGSLKSVTFKGTTPPTFGSNVFMYCNTALKIYVPVGCGDAYASKVTPTSVSGKVEEKQNI